MEGTAAIIVNFNGSRYLEDCIGAVVNSRHQVDEIIVVDNASTDSSVEMLSRMPGIRLIRLKKNFGPGDARNAGLAGTQCRYCLFLDNDALVEPACLSYLHETMASCKTAGAVTAVAVDYYHKPRVMFNGIDIHYLGVPILRHRGMSQNDLPGHAEETGGVSGLCTLIDRSRTSILYDSSYFWNLEDVDFSFRLRKQGLKCFTEPRAIVYHKEGTQNISVRDNTLYPSHRVFLLVRNRWFFILKNYSWATIILTLPAQAIYECLCLLFSLKNKAIPAYIHAHASLIYNLRNILKSRSSFSVPDLERDAALLTSPAFTFTEPATAGKIARQAVFLFGAFFSRYWNTVQPLLWGSHHK